MPMSRSVITNTGVCRRSARSSARPHARSIPAGLPATAGVLGVAVRGIGAGQQVGLLGARRHAGGGAAALHVDDGHRRDLGEVGQADELGHQRDAGPDVAVKARAPFQPAPITMPMEAISSSACTMAKLVLAGGGIDAELGAVFLERLGHRGRGRDRVPGATVAPP